MCWSQNGSSLISLRIVGFGNGYVMGNLPGPSGSCGPLGPSGPTPTPGPSPSPSPDPSPLPGPSPFPGQLPSDPGGPSPGFRPLKIKIKRHIDFTPFISKLMFTARNSSCGRVMFSQACVSFLLSSGGGVCIPERVCIQGASASRGVCLGVCIWGCD